MKKIPVILILASVLGGCSAAGVLNSSDPQVKMSQAMELLKYNRPIPAERLMKEALTLFEQQPSPEGARFATIQLALLYKSQGKSEDACLHFTSSNQYHLQAVAKNPNKNYHVMEPYNDWNEMIIAMKNKAGCQLN